MNLNYTELLPADFAGESRVWIYQSSRLFLPGEALQIETALKEFVGGWKSHGTPVKGYAGLFFGQFIIRPNRWWCCPPRRASADAALTVPYIW
jgi:hypothetical protein